MWLYPLLLALIALAIVGGALGGGVYTIVLIPLAGIALVTWAVVALWSRASAGGAGAPSDTGQAGSRPLPHHPSGSSRRVRTSPEALADARREQQ
jgi:hypothetical protein